MKRIKARERDHANAITAAHQTRQVRTQNGGRRADLRGDNSRPVAPVIPRQEIPGETESERYKQQNATDHPGGLPWLLVSAIDKYLDHVQHDDDDHHAGSPVMQAANEMPGGHLRHDIFHAVVSLAGRGRVIKRQQDSREYLHQESEQGHAPENLMPAAGCRDIFVEKIFDRGLKAGSLLQPFGNLTLYRHVRLYEWVRAAASCLPISLHSGQVAAEQAR